MRKTSFSAANLCHLKNVLYICVINFSAMNIAKSLITIALASFAATATADDGIVRITSESGLRDSMVCMITYKDEGGYRNLKCQQKPGADNDSILMFESDAAYSTLDELQSNTQTFMAVQKDGHWILENRSNGLYVGEVNASVIKNNSLFNFFLHSKNVDEKFYLSFSADKKGTQLLIGSSGLRYNISGETFRLLSSSNTAHPYAELYSITGAKSEAVLDISTDKDLEAQEFSGTVRLTRSFEDGYCNTVILPFNVARPQDVFGSLTTCYKPSASTDSTITFAKMDINESLKANTPYLIYGAFGASPYTFENVNFTHEEADSVVNSTVGSMTIHGVYKAQKVGGTGALILFQKTFYSCTNLKSMTVEPYKWYITSTSGRPSKLSLTQTDNGTLTIEAPTQYCEAGKEAVYTLQGIKMPPNRDSLPKGVYIINGRKTVID